MIAKKPLITHNPFFMSATKLNREHSFDTELAEIHGIEKSILLKNFDYWTRENERRQLGEYFFNGQYWTAESFNSICKKYKYMKKTSMRRWLDEMVESGWLDRVKRVGDVSFYRPGTEFELWNTGQNWGVGQNGTVGGPKWHSRWAKMAHNNIDINIELIKEVEEEKAQAEKTEIISTSKQKKTEHNELLPAAAPPAETPHWATTNTTQYNPGTPAEWRARIEQEANESATFDMWGMAFAKLGIKLEGPQDLAKRVADFEAHRITSATTYHRESDYRQHFKNWASKRRQIEDAPQQPARPTNYRQNQPTPAPQPRNYKGPVYGQ